MESSEDKHWAARYLLDPLNAPEPSQETGPGTSFVTAVPPRSNTSSTRQKSGAPVNVRSDQKPAALTSVRSSNNPYRQSAQNSTAYPSPPSSASPSSTRFPDFDESYPSNRNSTSQASTQIPTSTAGQNPSTVNGSNGNGHRTTRSRGSSLGQRHPGDQTHRPLEMLRQEAKTANRSPHLRKKHMVGADSIDNLDNVGPGAYHHEGPYDATLLARNHTHTSSPLEAVRATNEEALKATPKEMIQDSVERHRPLDGVAVIPPGLPDRYGNVLNYQEGTDMMIEGQPEGGAYRRWPGITYHPNDLKGKGEPAYSLEYALKQHRRNVSEPQPQSKYRHDRRPQGLNLPFRSASLRTANNKFPSPTTRLSGATLQNIEMIDSPTSPSGSGHRRHQSADAGGNRYRDVDGEQRTSKPPRTSTAEQETEEVAATGAEDLGRSDSMGGRLRKRFGSLRGRKPQAQAQA